MEITRYIYIRVLTRRLNTCKVVTEFVADCQKGFVPRAFIGEATMLLNSLPHIMEEEEEDSGGVSLFLYTEKAFDCILGHT